MIIEVDTASPTPPYEQVRSRLATMVRTGALPPGSQLPPIRQLAADLGLAANTVARAYRELESQGLVHSRVRHGTVVSAGQASVSLQEVAERLAEAAGIYAATARTLGAGSGQAVRAVIAAFERTGQAGEGVTADPDRTGQAGEGVTADPERASAPDGGIADPTRAEDQTQEPGGR